MFIPAGTAPKHVPDWWPCPLVQCLLNSLSWAGQVAWQLLEAAIRCAGCGAVPKGKLPKTQSRQDSYVEDAEKGLVRYWKAVGCEYELWLTFQSSQWGVLTHLLFSRLSVFWYVCVGFLGLGHLTGWRPASPGRTRGLWPRRGAGWWASVGAPSQGQSCWMWTGKVEGAQWWTWSRNPMVALGEACKTRAGNLDLCKDIYLLTGDVTVSGVVQTRGRLCPCIPGVWGAWAGSDRRKVNDAEVRIKME